MAIYFENGKVIQIKTLSYPQISKRTEEFYFIDGKLALAFIEDKGLNAKESEEGAVGKIFWFKNDKLIHDTNKSNEKELNSEIEHDGAGLVIEATEYLSMIKKP